MFREVARAKQALTREECLTLLKETRRGVLALQGEDGYPYAVPHNHWYSEEDGVLYFHSGQHGAKIDAIRRSDKASYCVMDEGTPVPDAWWLQFKSVIAFGRLEVVEDHARAIDISRALSLTFTQDRDYIEHEVEKSGPGVLVFALHIEHITGKRVTER
ncbi:MAG: pyridoxamine 5'-phosphate oxidase family protein [Oscillospiraceae bacterium]|nr:pyridoxamine 5'-phosphate oxidase family protein [Oscillospiraceae bacterium]